MTQKYYTERLLPVDINAVQEARISRNQEAILQENNDPSHGTRSELNVAKQLKDNNWIPVPIRPAQSPDLNPMEAIWGILKQRIRRRSWDNLNQLKEVFQNEWSKITMEEIRARIVQYGLINSCPGLVTVLDCLFRHLMEYYVCRYARVPIFDRESEHCLQSFFCPTSDLS
jgi:DDE superfamily endonuclease